MPTRTGATTAHTAWRVCRHCGQRYDSPFALYQAYVVTAHLINPRAVVDPDDPIGFCAACGADFPEGQGWR